jgi:hypothetical protein
MSANPLKGASQSQPMELTEEDARYWLESAQRRGNPEAIKAWKQYLAQFENERRTGS